MSDDLSCKELMRIQREDYEARIRELEAEQAAFEIESKQREAGFARKIGEQQARAEALEAEVEKLRRDLMSARDCAVQAENERDDVKAEVAALREGRGIVLEALPPECAPKGCPVLVAGGIAMKKTGGQWYSGMAKPAFERPITWEVKWWAPIPQQNDLSALSPAPVSVGASEHDLVQAAEALVKYHKWPAEAKHPSVYQTLVFSLSAALRALSETEGE